MNTNESVMQNKYEELTKSFENKGIFYLIEIDSNVVGIGGLRKLTENVCEIKRMYIRPKYRGLGFGKKLTQMLIKTVRKFGYSLIKLESSSFMETAHHMYRSYGFKDCIEYPGVETPDPLKAYSIYMEKEIS